MASNGAGFKGSVQGKDRPVSNGIGRAVGRREWRKAVWGAPARLLALLWLLVAVLAMPLVASAQIVAFGTGALLRTGDVSGREGRAGGAGDTALSRQTLRPAQPADLRFMTERVDAKPLPGGPDPFLTPGFKTPVFERHVLAAAIILADTRLYAGVSGAAQARAPPVAPLGRR
jgi:hypothetical protein